MNKKFLKSLFIGALLVGSVGTLTSCSKDYDNDINDLKTQLAQLTTLSTTVSSLQTAVTTATTTANNAYTLAKAAATEAELTKAVSDFNTAIAGKADQTALNDAVAKLTSLGADVTALQSALKSYPTTAHVDSLLANKADVEVVNALEKRLAAVEALNANLDQLSKDVESLKTAVTTASTDAAAAKEGVAKLQSEYEALNTLTTGLVGEVDKMVTDVDLQVQGDDVENEYNAALNFTTVTEEENTFGPDGAEYAKFTKGKIITYGDSLLVRVSPTTAVLTTDMISLLNSKGEELTGDNGFVNVTDVKPYTGKLLTRAATSASGIWTIYFNMKDNYDADAFAKAVMSGSKQVAFCVAVKSQLTGGGDRRVVSSYDVTVNPSEADNSGSLDFTANKVSVTNIRNRYYTSEVGASTIIANNEDYIWNPAKETPAVAIAADKSNVLAKADQAVGNDNRDNASLLPVVKGEQIAISINTTNAGDFVPIKGFYVALDRANAVESAPSEINAWDSYSYENVYVKKGVPTTSVFQPGNKGSITIKDMNNVAGDIIGFRVYAVNLDGTLVDPDGRAFYVKVANPAKTTTVETVVTPTKPDAENVSAAAAITDDLSDLADAKSYVKTQVQTGPAFYIRALDKDGNVLADELTPTFVADIAANASKIVAFASYINGNPQAFDDGASMLQTYDFKDADGAVIRTISVDQTKKMPTAAPAGFSAKTNQFVNGVFYCYLTPNDVAANATAGSLQLHNAFNGLKDADNVFDQGYQFTFAKAGAKDKDIEVVYTPGQYLLTVPAASILNDAKSYATTVVYNYGLISSVKDADGNYVDYSVPVATFNTTFRSYMADVASTLTWKWDADKSLTYGTAPAAAITGATAKHIYNTAEYSLTLEKLVAGGKLSDVKANLYSNIKDESTKDEYFTVTYNAGFVFAINPSSTSNPKDKVASILKVTAKDAYGNTVTFTLPMTVNPK